MAQEGNTNGIINRAAVPSEAAVLPWDSHDITNQEQNLGHWDPQPSVM